MTNKPNNKPEEEKRYCKLHSGTEAESEECPDCKREAMEEFECWLTEKHLKECKKCRTSSYEQGQQDILKLANDLTEKPDRAVRYVPLDKLIEAWQSKNN